MSRNRIEDFGPYQDALRLFDHVVEDMEMLRHDPRCYRLIGQQVGSADSICANMDEGFGRLSRAEFVRFLDISRGSARETLGRYKRLKHWLTKETIDARADLADKIVARLTRAIQTLRTNSVSSAAEGQKPYPARDTPNGDRVRECRPAYGTTADQDTITDKEIDQLLGIE